MAIVQRSTEYGQIVYDDEYEGSEGFARDFAKEDCRPSAWLAMIARVRETGSPVSVQVDEHGLVNVGIGPDLVGACSLSERYRMVMPTEDFTDILTEWERMIDGR